MKILYFYLVRLSVVPIKDTLALFCDTADLPLMINIDLPELIRALLILIALVTQTNFP